MQNQVYACPECAESKDGKDLAVWWCDNLGRDKNELPRIPAGLFLKMAHERHTVALTLNKPRRSIRGIW